MSVCVCEWVCASVCAFFEPVFFFQVSSSAWFGVVVAACAVAIGSGIGISIVAVAAAAFLLFSGLFHADPLLVAIREPEQWGKTLVKASL